MTCTRKAVADYRRNGTDITVTCGSYYAGSQVFCDPCERKYTREFPQGWRGYPGDTCKHGVYVGGCGADIMCGACEAA